MTWHCLIAHQKFLHAAFKHNASDSLHQPNKLLQNNYASEKTKTKESKLDHGYNLVMHFFSRSGNEIESFQHGLMGRRGAQYIFSH